MAESEDFEKMKDHWDSTHPSMINWNKIGFPKQAKWLIDLILESLSREESVYISAIKKGAAVIYNEFDFEKMLELVYNIADDEFSLELLKTTSEGNIKHYKHILNTKELQVIPLSAKKSMQKVASTKKSKLVPATIFSLAKNKTSAL